jgi:hypothetical protein
MDPVVLPLTVAVAPPNVTCTPETKFEPDTVTAVPPDAGPLLGDTLVRLGGRLEYWYAEAPLAVDPSMLRTVTSTVPVAWGGVVT